MEIKGFMDAGFHAWWRRRRGGDGGEVLLVHERSGAVIAAAFGAAAEARELDARWRARGPLTVADVDEFVGAEPGSAGRFLEATGGTTTAPGKFAKGGR